MFKKTFIILFATSWLMLLICIPAQAQQRPSWKVEVTETSNSFRVHLDARNIPNSSYLQNVFVTVNFYDRHGRRLNKKPQKYELHAEGIVDVFKQGEYDFKFPVPYGSANSIKGINMKCQQVVNGRFVNLDISPSRITAQKLLPSHQPNWTAPILTDSAPSKI